MRSLAAVILVLGVLGASTPTGGQGQRATKPGFPDGQAATRPQTGVIRGRITAFGTQAGVRQATVLLNQGQRGTTTDNDGRYEFKALAAGRYTVSVTKPPFLTVEYAQRAPREPGRPIELADGQVAENINIVLPRACVIGGIVFDDIGEPAEQVRVAALRVQRSAGGPTVAVVGSAVRTNDLGQYRISGLPPGRYYIGTAPPVSDSVPKPIADRAFRATYYPGTSNFVEALPIVLDVGQQFLDVNFGLTVGRAARVLGRVMNRGRGTPGWTVQAIQPLGDGSGSFIAATAGVRPDGSFTITQLGAGDYTLLATGKDPETGADMCGWYHALVGDADLNVAIAAGPLASISGYVSLQYSSGTARRALPQLPDVMAGIHITVEATADSPRSPSSTMATSGVFGRFDIENIVPGRMRLRVTGLPDGWLLDSITDVGRDVTDIPMDVRGSVSAVTVTLTDLSSEVSGTVTDAVGRSVTDYLVIAFPENPALRDSQRLLVTARPDQDGRFSIRGLPRGSYYAFAVERLMVDDPFDRQYLESQRPDATRFSLLKGESKTLNLQLARQ